jgi:hypothetical protein
MERQEGTGKERKKGLKRFHDALALPHARRQVKLETGKTAHSEPRFPNTESGIGNRESLTLRSPSPFERGA